MKRHVEQAQRNGFFIKWSFSLPRRDGIFGSNSYAGDVDSEERVVVSRILPRNLRKSKNES